MKNWKNIITIFSILLFVGSMSSCSASKRGGKSKRKRGCKCPKWSQNEQVQPADKVEQTEIVVFEADAE